MINYTHNALLIVPAREPSPEKTRRNTTAVSLNPIPGKKESTFRRTTHSRRIPITLNALIPPTSTIPRKIKNINTEQLKPIKNSIFLRKECQYIFPSISKLTIISNSRKIDIAPKL